jgi:MATE family multidrug resistance protein
MTTQSIKQNKPYKIIPTKEKLKKIFTVMIPILITQLAIMGMSVIDTAMSGHAGTADLAGVAMGSSLWLPILTCFGAFVSAETPIIAHHLGAKREQEIGPTVRHGAYIAIIISFLIILVGLFIVSPIFTHIGLEPAVFKIAIGYLIAIAFGIIPLFITISLRSFVDTLSYTSITMRLFIIALPINALLNYIFIFGALGIPAFGGIGAGIATSITNWILLLAFIITIKKTEKLNKYGVFSTFGFLEFYRIKEQLRIGIPIGVAIFFETSLFSGLTFIIAKFGTVVIAGHQAAMNFSTLLYMFPLSFSLTLVILVGYEVGAKRFDEAISFAKLGVGLNMIISWFFIALILLARKNLATFYSNDLAIINTTATFMFYVAFFQGFDSIGAPIQGVLRGYKDVDYPFYVSLFSYWGIALPLGYLIDTKLGHGPESYWQGLIIGVLVSAILLIARLIYRQRQAKVEISNNK